MIRSFIAIEIPASIQEGIARSTAGLQRALPKPLVRWVAQKNVHLTLKFLGDISPVNLDRLAEALKVEVAQHEPFRMEAAGIGAFPTARRARVLWIGLTAPAALLALQRGVEGVAARLGYPAEEREFSPHLTIGRVSQNASSADQAKIRAALDATQIGSLGSVNVEVIHIFKSDLQPTGSVYKHLFALPLKLNS